MSCEYDPLLGWRLAPNLPGPGLRTLEHGIRVNSDETEVRTGGILAAGDSFTAGSEVVDADTWPAQLERLTGIPVLNAGCGGWGVDQIVMRLEQLIPVVQPRLVLLGMLDQDITRCNYSWGGKPKPYFLVENGELVLKHNPVPIHHKGTVAELWEQIRGMIPRIAAGGPDSDFWADWSRDGVTVDNDPVDVTCRLIARLRQATDVPIALFMQHGGYIPTQSETMPAYAQYVLGFAQSLGIPAFSEFDTLRAILLENAQDFAALYMPHPPPLIFGHMSPAGNARVARLIAEQLNGNGMI